MALFQTKNSPSIEDSGLLGARMAPVLAHGIVVAVFIAFAVTACINVSLLGGGLAQLVMAIGYVSIVLLLQLTILWQHELRVPHWVLPLALIAQTALVYLPIVQFGRAWVGLPGFLGGSLLLTLRTRIAVPLCALVVVTMGMIAARISGEPAIVVYTVVATTNTALMVFGLTRLAWMVNELRAAREATALKAVAEERLRVSRDVHDLLGLSLSAITLKSELANKLVTRQPQRAQIELADILALSRKALADVRGVASGERKLSLDEECHSAETVLTSAEVKVRIERQDHELPNAMGSVLATVLREGVTNILRHSDAESCKIRIGQQDDSAWMEIVNDGVSAPSMRTSTSGNGISNLTRRVVALGGELDSGDGPNGDYQLRVKIPIHSAIDEPNMVAA